MGEITVTCDDHGPMRRDMSRLHWTCDECSKTITDAEVYRLSRDADDSDIVVT